MCSRGFKKLQVIDVGMTEYAACRALQKDLVQKRTEGIIPDSMILTEHRPVITMGRGTDRENLLVSEEKLKERGVELYEIERGGDITYHGPGQLVVYPIIDLHHHGKDVHRYLRELENTVIAALDEYELKASTKPGLTGIWVDDRKIGAIGVAVSHWVTYHGLALNVNNDLDNFELINPCGITEYKVTSMAEALGHQIDMNELKDIMIDSFTGRFYYEIEEINDINLITGVLSSQ